MKTPLRHGSVSANGSVSGRGIALLGAALLTVPTLFAPALLAQGAPPSHLRGWGGGQFDTSAFDVPANFFTTWGVAAVMHRTDGRVFVFGERNLRLPPVPPTGITYTKISFTRTYGQENGLALRSDGNIVSWANTGAGLPAPALPANVTYVQLEVGYDHVLALRSDGIAVAWGSNAFGQATIPTPPAGTTVTEVRACQHWSMQLLSNGQIQAFGNNQHGQLTVPTLPTGMTYTRIFGGNAVHAFAERSDGTLVAWGNNTYGQASIPALPSGLSYVDLAFSYNVTIALRSDGTLVPFGDLTGGAGLVPTLPPLVPVAQISAGFQLCAVRLNDGRVFAWGDQTNRALPTAELNPGEQWASSSAGFYGFGLTTAGRVVRIGDMGLIGQPPVPPAGMTYTKVMAGSSHAVALRSDGRAIAWGSNNFGQCAVPPLPPGMTYTGGEVVTNSTALLRSDGTIVQFGQSQYAVPALPQGMRYEQLSRDDQGLMLLRSDGEVVALGGTGNNQAAPTLPTGVKYVAVARGRTFNAALRSDGQLALWGSTMGLPLQPLPAGVYYVTVNAGDDDLLLRRSDGLVDATSLTQYSTLHPLPVPETNESIVEVSANRGFALARIGPTRTYVSFASGCAGTQPASRLVPHDTPHLGSFHQVEVFDLPQDAAVMLFGWNRTAPVSLSNYGMPGCFQHITADAAVLLLGRDGHANYYVGIPNQVSLLGLHFHNQALVFDANANAAGAVVSDAAEGVIGAQ